MFISFIYFLCLSYSIVVMTNDPNKLKHFFIQALFVKIYLFLLEISSVQIPSDRKPAPNKGGST